MIDTAFILAGGRGSRLAPWPAPKCLLPINGVSILQRLIAHVSPHVGRVVVCAGYRSGDVRAALRKSPEVTVSDAGENAEMGERLLKAGEGLGITGRAIILYGDELADVDIAELERCHDSARAVVTFAACRQVLSFGVVHEGWINAGREVLVNIGFALVDPPAWKFLHCTDGLDRWINKARSEEEAAFYVHEGRRATVNSLADLQYAEEVWA